MEDVNNKKRKEEPKEGLALKKWGLFFFVLSCIATLLIVASLALPFLIGLFGVVSVIAWLAIIAIVTIFTIGMIWTVEEAKTINTNWMAFNNWLFSSTETVANTAAKAIPAISIIGGAILAITWLFMIIGLLTDKNRKKYYKGIVIALGIITFIYIAIAVVTIILHSEAMISTTSSSSNIQ